MDEPLTDIFQRLARPLLPRSTGVTPVLRPLEDVSAVLFDVYGTLVISASGEVGTAEDATAEVTGTVDTFRPDALLAAFAAVGLRLPRAARSAAPADDRARNAVELLGATIESHHARARAAGIDTPEVVITDVWRDVLSALAANGLLDGDSGPFDPDRVDPGRLAAHFEARVNPTWPMPGASACIAALSSSGLCLGIVSNAQAYTRPMLEALFASSPEGLGFDPDLQYYSYQRGIAKPGCDMYLEAAARLADRGIATSRVLYVGNDMRNDIWPARKVGFRTALFAGDARSLRLRADDPALAGIEADLVITSLDQLPGCLAGSPPGSPPAADSPSPL